MSRDELPGDFLSGGFRPLAPTVELPDPNDVTKGTLYRDENGQIWRLQDRPGTEGRRITQWAPVTAVSAEQQKRNRRLESIFCLAAFGGAFLAFQLARALELSALWGMSLVGGVFTVFVLLTWLMSNRVGRQVVLPAEAEGLPDERSTLEMHPGTE